MVAYELRIINISHSVKGDSSSASPSAPSSSASSSAPSNQSQVLKQPLGQAAAVLRHGNSPVYV